MSRTRTNCISKAVAALAFALLALPAAAQTAAPNHAAKGRELMAAGRYEASLPFFQRELALAEAKLGPDHPSVAAELNDLAEANRLAGRLEIAEALYERALALDEQARSKDPEGLATTLNNLALVYREQARLGEAERLHTRSLDLLRDSLGPNDPRVAMGLHNLATVYRQQGRIDEARAAQERAVAVADQALGPRHPDTVRFRTRLAALGPAAPGAAPVEAPPPRRSPGKSALPPPPLMESEPPRAAGRFAVQLASVPRADQVTGEWRRLVRRHPELAGLELQPAETVEVAGKGTFHRIIAGPLGSRAEAEALCARLKRAGASCRLAQR